MMANNVSVTGINQVIANISNIERQVRDKVKQNVTEVCLDLQGKAQLRAPVDTGDLRGSASTNVVESNDKITGTVGFSMPYALEQHENLQYRHPRGGEAKYLENPLKENETQYKNKIKNSIRDVIT